MKNRVIPECMYSRAVLLCKRILVLPIRTPCFCRYAQRLTEHSVYFPLCPPTTHLPPPHFFSFSFLCVFISLCVCVFPVFLFVFQRKDAYMAPELMYGNPYGTSADMFSFGIVLWETIYRQKVCACVWHVGGVFVSGHTRYKR